MNKWLVTAFAPFAGATTNSSLIVLNELRKGEWGGRVEFHAPVPVTFADAWKDVRRVLDSSKDWRGVLCLGQAETRSKVCLERVALNWIDARIADNSGETPSCRPVSAGAPDMYWCNIPWEGFEPSPLSERSYSAGTFVCNTLMYQALGWAVPEGKLAGFIHLPVLESQVEKSFEKCPKMRDALAIGEVERILRYVLDL